MHDSAPTRTGWAALRGRFPHPSGTPQPDGLAAVYRRREPTATPLYPIVQHHLETFLADATAADPHGEGVPDWVEDDFRAYLRCGAWPVRHSTRQHLRAQGELAGALMPGQRPSFTSASLAQP
ncbi:MAG: hypothetical protein ACRENP_30290 [Longimicrobiales bacterium]